MQQKGGTGFRGEEMIKAWKVLVLALVVIGFSSTADGQMRSRRALAPAYNYTQAGTNWNYTPPNVYPSGYQVPDELPSPQASTRRVQDTAPPVPNGNTRTPTELPVPNQLQPNSGSQSRNVTPEMVPMGNRSVDPALPSMPSGKLVYPDQGFVAPIDAPDPLQASCCPDHAPGAHPISSPGVIDFTKPNSMRESIGAKAWCDGDCEGGCDRCRPEFGLRKWRERSLEETVSAGAKRYAFFDFGGYFGDSDSSFGGPNAANRGRYPHRDNVLFSGGFGRYFSDRFRMDISSRYRFVEVDGGFVNSTTGAVGIDGGSNAWTGMLTGRHDLPGLHPCIKPYVSAGVGLAFHRTHATSIVSQAALIQQLGHYTEESTEFSWAVGGGVAFKMTRNVYFDLDYQYIDLGDVSSGIDINGDRVLFDDLVGHEVALRLRFDF